MKSVQISYDLFIKLARYFCADQREYEAEIRAAIEEKVNRLANRQRYKKAMAADNANEKKELLNEYYQNKKRRNMTI